MRADAESSCPESRTDSWSQDGARKPWSAPTTELWAPTGRPCTSVELRRLIIEMAASNPAWGYRRITGELVGLGHRVGASTVWRILKQHRIDPAPQRTSLTWTQFLRSQAAIACDFVTVDTALLRRYYLLFFIDITNREVLYGGITANPTAAWTTQSARNLLLRHPQQITHTRALVRDRASQFTGDFDEIFRTEGLKILRTPVRVPVANAFAERWVGTLRRELLDRTIIWNQRQLQRLVINYIDHYNMRVRIRVGSTGGDGSITTCSASWWWLRVVSASPPVPVRRCRLIEA